jgi:hypothetical protein
MLFAVPGKFSQRKENKRTEESLIYKNVRATAEGYSFGGKTEIKWNVVFYEQWPGDRFPVCLKVYLKFKIIGLPAQERKKNDNSRRYTNGCNLGDGRTWRRYS